MIETGRYEEALGLDIDTKDVRSIHKAFILSTRHNDDQIRSALSTARNVILSESEEEKKTRLSRIGIMLYSQGLRQRALTYLEQAAILNGSSEYYHYLGATLYDLGRKKEAIPYLEKAVELRGGKLDHIRLGVMLYNQGRREEALVYLERAALKRTSEIEYLLLRFLIYEIKLKPDIEKIRVLGGVLAYSLPMEMMAWLSLIVAISLTNRCN
jgi:tetratricopeptide (TPR) repeat protein